MVSYDHHQHPHYFQSSWLTSRTLVLNTFSDVFLCIGGLLVALLLLWVLRSFHSPSPSPTPDPIPKFSTTIFSQPKPTTTDISVERCAPTVIDQSVNSRYDPLNPTFFDYPSLTYSVEMPLENWDHERKTWLQHHPSFAAGAAERILLISGSQSTPCKNLLGDHLLLRFFKNKVDYYRIHRYDIFYNNVLLQPKMFTFWAKIPAVRAAMVAHPEVEWIWWVDSDAVFTDIDFKLPLARYKDHNLVIHGWPHLIYEAKSWTSINAGVFLIRNCQWSVDFMEVWARMGPQNPNYDTWGATLKSTFKDKIFPESDDQSGLVYLLLKEKEKWGNKIYVEEEYYFEGYWLEIVENFENIREKV